jgi:hypothetical protein
MAKQQTGPSKTIAFRVAPERHELLARYAAARGEDATAVLNRLLEGAAPAMTAFLAARGAGSPGGAHFAALRAMIGGANALAVEEAVNLARAHRRWITTRRDKPWNPGQRADDRQALEGWRLSKTRGAIVWEAAARAYESHRGAPGFTLTPGLLARHADYAADLLDEAAVMKEV